MCAKFIPYLRGRIQTRSDELQRLILGAFYKSLLIYFFTPIAAAGAIKKEEVIDLETAFVWKQLLLPNNIKSLAIRNVM